MALNNVTFNRTNGLGTLADGEDYISGLLFYSDTLPSGFTSGNRVKKIFNLQGAEDLGITDDYADETKATDATVEITLTGAEDDEVSITLDSVVLGSYTLADGDAVGDVATGLGAAINALSGSHGFTASVSTATVTITAPDGLGVIPKDATLAYSAGGGSSTATVTQFADGTGSFRRVMHYHISEFFRVKPDGVLYVGIYAVPSAFDGTEVKTMQDEVAGDMRQIAVYYPNSSFASSQLTALQTQLETLRDNNRQLFCVLHANCYSLTLANLPDLRLLTASKTNTNIAEDGNWLQPAYSSTQTYNNGDKVTWMNKTYSAITSSTGKAPYNTSYFSEISENIRSEVGYSVSTLGQELGTIADAEVHESIAYVDRFNAASGNNLDTLGFATGDLYKDVAKSLLDTLDNYHYTFLRKFERNSGSYYNDSYTAIAKTSDYATIENNRTMDKAERLVYDQIVPLISSPLNLKSDGTLRQTDIDIFENKASIGIESMANNISVDDDGEAQFDVDVPAEQNVSTTSKLDLTLKLLPKGVTRDIVVNNSYVVSL